MQYAAKEFGTCPLAQCSGQPVLPVGVRDEMGADTVKIFCPKCQCVYHPPPIRSRSSSHHGAGAAGVDGAAFGTTFPHLFLMTFSNLVPDPLPNNSAYVPRVFGFRVHMSARQRTPSNTAAASGGGDAQGKSAAKTSSRPGYPSRKTSSQSGRNARSDKDSKAGVAANDAGGDPKRATKAPSAAPGAPVFSNPTNAAPAVAAVLNAANLEENNKAAAAAQQAVTAGNKRRADGGIEAAGASSAKKADGNGNGFLIDSSAAAAAKRRKA